MSAEKFSGFRQNRRCWRDSFEYHLSTEPRQLRYNADGLLTTLLLLDETNGRQGLWHGHGFRSQRQADEKPRDRRSPITGAEDFAVALCTTNAVARHVDSTRTASRLRD